MDILWEDQQLRQQTLNQFGQSTGMYYQFYHFGETAFYFSDNISDLIGDIPQGYFSKSQWYSLIYEPDRKKLRQYTRQAFYKDEEQYSFNYRIRNRQGQLIWVSSQGKCIFDQQGNPLYFLGFLTPRNDREFEGGHNHQAALLQKLRSVHSQGQEGYLLLVDVDNLSRINLKYGRMFGDGVLLDLAEAMSHGGPGFSHPFRNNGSCFCTLAIGVSRNEVEDYFAALQQTMYGQCTLSGGCVSLQKYQVPDSDMLIHYAESALDSAKLAGKAQLFFFNPENYERKLSAIELQADLEAAVKDHFAGFSLQYQPQVRSETFELAGAEALLRFVSPKQGAVSPAEFVPILERTGLIIPVGMWVLRTVLEQCRLWRQELPDFRISVNMSYVQLSRPEIQAEVLDALRESGLPGSALTLEVTEGTELQEYTYLNTIFSAWEKEGIEISVDDFGTGYSSLSWLKKLAIDEIKIDRCFVSGIQHSAYNLRLLDNIIELANSRCLQVCCEGVETEEELTTLETLQPGLYQGFFFSRPLSPEDFSPQDLQQRLQKKHRKEALPATVIEQAVADPGILEHAILEKTEDAISVCDIRTYEVYYLNPAAQRIFGAKNYKGQKCYKVLHGRDAPCEFCPNALLRHDSFYVWEEVSEYCDRHFLLKDKLLDDGSKTLRFQVAMDITKQECVSRQTRERLDFANRIAGYADMLSRQQDWRCAVELALKFMGDFYKADRAYLFEISPEHSACWKNTFEWCAPGVTPQKENLQQVPTEAAARWLDNFHRHGSVILYNLEPLRRKHPLEWEILSKQDIQRVISVPLFSGGQVAGFIGVDNPRYAIEDDTQARVLASFLTVRFRRERKEWQVENASECSCEP